MTSYDDLSSLIPKITEAAIDWRMQIMEWGPRNSNGSWTNFGITAFWECDNHGNTYLNGERTEDSYYRDFFADWRSTVPEVLQPWTELPNPSSLDWRVNQLRTQMNTLLDPADVDTENVDPEASGVPSLGNGELHSARETIDAKLGAMSGYSATQMYEVLVTRMDDVVRGEFAATGVLGLHLAGEMEILTKARTDVAALFDACYEVMDNMGLVGGTVDLKVVTALASAVGVFATGGLSTALSAIGAAVGLHDAFLPKAEAPNPIEVQLAGYDAEESWSLMVAALSELNESFTDQERDLSTRGSNAASLVSGSASFDLSKISGQGSDPSVLGDAGDVIDIDKGGLKYIAEVSIPGATTNLDRTAIAIEDINPSYVLTRPASIGYGTDGIYPAWSTLQDATVAAIKGTANELWDLRSGVIAVLEDFGVTDVEQAERYQKPVPEPGYGGRSIPV